jgi:hypothetical protein
MSGTCPSCGFTSRIGELERPPVRCPGCGTAEAASIVPVVAAMVALLAMLAVALGVAAWSMPAGPYLLASGFVALAVCVATIVRSIRRGGAKR